ncbi:LysE family translocator, partial [Enterobacter sp. JH8]|uniref:LysE family translocator n=1 Tax=Enterobacter sp. JH8 TaxID=2923086 RepID=UPI00208E58BE
AGYLIYIGVMMWRAKATIKLETENQLKVSRQALFSQGFITAIANPKGWAFMISLLPPFINIDSAIAPQLSMLVAIIMLSEFTCMMLY